MNCSINSYYCGGGIYKKSFKWKHMAESTTNTGKDNNESRDFDSSLPKPARRWMVSSIDNPNRSKFGLSTYTEMIAKRVSIRKWKLSRKRHSWIKVGSRRVAPFKE
ncbi:unnamed protein product [Linum trigynum]|uniref:Uncharacterized protein n=1 Tax=Linum trigynum TaxID=586398 RepID=A0AAV2CEF9_9ROSI